MSYLSQQTTKVPGKAMNWSKIGLLKRLIGLLSRKEGKLIPIPVPVR